MWLCGVNFFRFFQLRQFLLAAFLYQILRAHEFVIYQGFLGNLGDTAPPFPAHDGAQEDGELIQSVFQIRLNLCKAVMEKGYFKINNIFSRFLRPFL